MDRVDIGVQIKIIRPCLLQTILDTLPRILVSVRARGDLRGEEDLRPGDSGVENSSGHFLFVLVCGRRIDLFNRSVLCYFVAMG